MRVVALVTLYVFKIETDGFKFRCKVTVMRITGRNLGVYNFMLISLHWDIFKIISPYKIVRNF